MIISFEVENQIIKRTDKNRVVADSRNYLYAEFSFTEEWTGTVTAVFKKDSTSYAAIINGENKCMVPWEVLGEGRFSVSCFCGNRVTANKEYVTVIASGYEQGKTPSDPTPDVYSGLVELFDSAAQKADEVFTAYENGELKGEKGDTGAPAENQFPVLDWTSLSLSDFAQGGKVDTCGAGYYITSHDIALALKNEYIIVTGEESYFKYVDCINSSNPDFSSIVYPQTATAVIPAGSMLLVHKEGSNVLLKITKVNLPFSELPLYETLIIYVPGVPLIMFTGNFLYESVEKLLQSSKNGFHNYSLSERRIGTWVDGKPLYERSYNVTMPSTNAQTVISEIDATDFDKVIKIDAVTVEKQVVGSDVYISTTPTGNSYYRTSSERLQFFYSCLFDGTNNGINVYCGSYYFGRQAVITVRYTKVSDGGN